MLRNISKYSYVIQLGRDAFEIDSSDQSQDYKY